MKKLVKVVAAALAVTMLAGCGASASSSTTEQASSSQATAQTTTADGKSVIRVGIGSDPASFGPFEAGGNGKNATFRTIYEPLAEYQGVGGECKAVVAKNTLFPYTTLFRLSEERRVGKECSKKYL